jgi:ribonuclease-3
VSENNYERLEFLGDAVLQLIITKNLYKTYPHIDEGTLSREKQSIVSKKIISKISLELRLTDFLISKNLDLNSSLSLKNTIASNMIESLIGALFLDSNYSICEEIVSKIFSKYLIVKKDIGIKDSKTLLQEHMQSLSKPLPVYTTTHMEGPPHQPGFKITCKISIYKETFESKSVTVREGQQAVSKIILDKINNEKKI